MGIFNNNPKYVGTFFAPDIITGPEEPPEEYPNEVVIKLRTREENLVARISGAIEAKTIVPKTRKEYFLSMIAGDTDPDAIAPKTKNEYILASFIADARDPVPGHSEASEYPGPGDYIDPYNDGNSK